MRIRLTVGCNGPDGATWAVGEAHDAPDPLARELIARGWAVPADREAAPIGAYQTHDAPITARDPVAPKRSKR